VGVRGRKFCSHHGIDWDALRDVIDDAEEASDPRGSTITQQVAKNLFLWQGRSIVARLWSFRSRSGSIWCCRSTDPGNLPQHRRARSNSQFGAQAGSVYASPPGVSLSPREARCWQRSFPIRSGAAPASRPRVRRLAGTYWPAQASGCSGVERKSRFLSQFALFWPKPTLALRTPSSISAALSAFSSRPKRFSRPPRTMPRQHLEDTDMAVPEEKHRLAAWHAPLGGCPEEADLCEDKDSGELRRPHHLDLKTGMYKGRQVLKAKKESDHGAEAAPPTAARWWRGFTRTVR